MTTDKQKTTNNAPFPGFFVDTSWLENHLQHPGLRIIQVGGEKYYPQFHIPGASLLSYKDLVTIRDAVPGVRADTTFLTKCFGSHGIAIDTPVLAYDLSNGMDAARAIWTLASLGHTSGAILDGGLGIWFQEKRPVDYQTPPIKTVPFLPAPHPEWEATEQQVIAASQTDHNTRLLDTRTSQEYQGLSFRKPRGHIAGAVHFNWVDALLGHNNPRLKDKQTLLSQFAQVGVVEPQQEIIVYCETGHRAAQTWLLLRQLGFANVRLYDGSIAEWRVREHPVVSGGTPR